MSVKRCDSGSLDGWCDAIRSKTGRAKQMVHYRLPNMPGYKEAYNEAYKTEMDK